MIRPPVSSTSTREAVAPPARKKRRRSAPDTSTMSPASHLTGLLLVRRHDPLHDDTQVPHRVAARQLAQLRVGRQPTHQPHLVDGLRLVLDQVGALDLLC
jgi:hypothetical protein